MKKTRFAKLREIGCLIANNWPDEGIRCEGRLEINHLNSMMGPKRDDERTICLCFGHHQRQSSLPLGEAYHKGSKKFREKYGTDDELLAIQNQLLEQHA